MKTILASNSPRRKELLKRLIPEFSILPADIDETLPEDIGIEFAPIFLSAQKAQDICRKFPDHLIIAADTVVILDDKILGKPSDEKEAFSMLKSLSGKTHTVITGVCLGIGEDMTTFSEQTEVEFFDLTDNEINEYIKTKSPLDKAGAYGIQDNGAFFIKRINGDYYNVMGLPIARLKKELEDFLKNKEA